MSMLRSPLGAPVRPLARKVTEAGGGVAWRAALPALRSFVTANYNQPNPHNQAVMASPPTITSGAGSSTAPAAPYTHLTNSARFAAGTLATKARFDGGGSLAYATDFRRFPVATRGASGGNVSTTENAIAWRATAVADAAAVGFRVLGGSVNQYRFIVDGKYVSATASSNSTGGRMYFVLDFGSKAVRTITIEGKEAASLDGIHVASGDSLTMPAAPGASSILFFGDSFTEGAGATFPADGYARVCADGLGLGAWQSGVGGTGYVATSSGTAHKLADRLSADVQRYVTETGGRAGIVVVAMGVNDISLSGIQAEAEACLASIRASNPGAQIFVVGPWDTAAPTAPSAGYTACKTAIQAAITARGGANAGITFLDPQGVSFTKADGTHPDTAGHKTLGDWLALQIKTALGA